MAQEIINVGSGDNSGNGDPLRTAMIKVQNNFDELYPLTAPSVSFGVYNYQNTLSAITVPATTWTTITNNGAGSDTLTTGGITGVDIYNTTTNQFNFTGLSVFDSIDYVFNGTVATTSVNQEVRLRLLIGVGTLDIPIEFSEIAHKTVGNHNVGAFLQNHLFTSAIKAAPAEIQVWSEAAATLTVDRFFVKASKRTV